MSRTTISTTPAGSDEERFAAFFAPPMSVQELAAQQGVVPVEDLDDLRVEFWPDSDSLEEFAATIRQWRREGG